MHVRLAAALCALTLSAAAAHAQGPRGSTDPGAGGAQRMDRAQPVQPSPYGRNDPAPSNEQMMGSGGGSGSPPRSTGGSARWQQDLRTCYTYQDRETCRKEMDAARAAGLYR
jgi:hypothetical protein